MNVKLNTSIQAWYKGESPYEKQVDRLDPNFSFGDLLEALGADAPCETFWDLDTAVRDRILNAARNLLIKINRGFHQVWFDDEEAKTELIG